MITNQRFQFLDGLRGIAALWVALMHFHTLIAERSPLPFILSKILQIAHVGVNIFFVLSGFVIAYSIRNEYISWRFAWQFILRRSLRLDPPYWVALILLTGLILLGPLLFNQGHFYVPTTAEFLLNAFYLQNFFQIKNILPVAWTLCLELQFYCFFILMLKITQRGYRELVFGGLFILSLLFAFLPSPPGLFIPFWYHFFIGCLLCWVFLNTASDIYLYLALLLMGASSILFNNHEASMTLTVSLAILACMKTGQLHAWLSSPIFQYLGKISYSLYLTHWLVGLKFISSTSYLLKEYHISPLFLLAMSLLMSIAVSELFYRYVENPCILLSKKLKNLFKSKIITPTFF